MDDSTPTSPKVAAHVAGDELGYVLRFLRKHGWRMAPWFFCLLLPLWGFAALVGEIHEKEVFPFDAPMLNMLHKIATPSLDRFFVLVSKVGFLWGTIPMDVVVLLWLAMRRRFRDGLFFGLAVVGSAVLDVAGKNYFVRMRPDLWLSITPENNYSFPSGHAMGSATLGMALIFLCWPTRWRWPVLVGAVVFVVLVGLSRLYLGVHYPSDILAGWCAAVAWVFGMHTLVDRKAPVPPPTAATGKDTIVKTSAAASQ
ncbi:MAG TPA: phosphatase PAP2 family protein [Xanthomonadaceae bacterium]|nr:phosphatase PAP2 family protein [Xanthomonadaceae bacterium]